MIRSIVFATFLVALAGAAQAHSKTEGSTPAGGATVAEAPEIALAFDAPMRVISITLMRGGDEVALERETGMEPTLSFRAMPEEALAPGDYRVDWRGMSADGHPMQGGFSFTVAE